MIAKIAALFFANSIINNLNWKIHKYVVYNYKIGAGLTIGREGPFVHISAALANNVIYIDHMNIYSAVYVIKSINNE